MGKSGYQGDHETFQEENEEQPEVLVEFEESAPEPEQLDVEECLAIKKQLEKMETEKNEMLALTQRLQADFENFRRRTKTEKEDLIKFAAEGVIAQLLPVIDNFERAINSAKEGTDSQKFVEGVDMIYRQLMQVLTNEGLSPVEAVGCCFDPACHNAVMQVEEEGMEKDMVLDELQKGYTLKGKLIRPSMVRVTK